MLAIAFLVVVGVAANMVAPQPSPAMSTGSASTGLARFEAPGIVFAYPSDWIDMTATVKRGGPGADVIAVLVDGMPACAGSTPAASMVTVMPACLNDSLHDPGALVFSVARLNHPGPGLVPYGSPTTIDGRSAWTAHPEESTTRWMVWGPGEDLYLLSAFLPEDEAASRATQIGAVLDSIRLSEVPAPAQSIVGDRVVLQAGAGLSFSYPIGWSVYYPHSISTMDASLVLVSSKPLEPCPTDGCQEYVVPEGAIAVEFRIGGSPRQPDWTTTTLTIGGQPAFRHDWGQPNAHGGVGHSWNIRFGEAQLSIAATLRNPGIPALELELQRVLDSVTLAPPEGGA